MEENREERIRRALNESKKRDLEEKYGAHFSEGESPLPPEIEAQFLQNVEQFEQQYKQSERLTLRQFIGDPSFTSLKDIPTGQLEPKLESVLEKLEENGVVIDFLCDVPLEERYRFITEELLDEEIDDIRIEGFRHHFIYEEFHPNDQYDATMFAENFLRPLLGGDAKFALNALSKEELLDAAGAHVSREAMEGSIREFMGKIMTFIDKEIEQANCVVDGDYATVRFNIRWDGLMAETLSQKKFSGIARIRMKRSPYDGWDVVQAIVPGWNSEG